MNLYIIKGLGIFPANDLYDVIVEVKLQANSMEDAIERAKLVARFRSIMECRAIGQ